jgi:bacterioferritin
MKIADEKQTQKIVNCLNQIYQEEMAGINRYLHYSFMIMGHNRIPIQKWFRDQATESMGHAISVGEKITALGGHPTHRVGEVPETATHLIEHRGLELYKELVKLAVDIGDIALEEMGREMVLQETEHIEEVEKMIRKNK